MIYKIIYKEKDWYIISRPRHMALPYSVVCNVCGNQSGTEYPLGKHASRSCSNTNKPSTKLIKTFKALKFLSKL